MKRVYFLRHQHEGVITQFAFSEEPSAEQLAPFLAALAARHGTGKLLRGPDDTDAHQASDGPWSYVVSVPVFEPGEAPATQPSGATAPSGGAVQPIAGSGTGTVA